MNDSHVKMVLRLITFIIKDMNNLEGIDSVKAGSGHVTNII